jgi:hypothetical protein
VELFLLCPTFIGLKHGANNLKGSMVIHVKSGYGVDPYFNIPMPISMKEWRKKWFYLRNDASTLLTTFTGNRLIPLPVWGYRVARRDLGKLQPMCEAL